MRVGGVLSFVMLLIALAANSCKKDKPDVQGTIRVNLDHRVGDKVVVWDDIRYKNKAGNPYGLSSLQYFLSHFSFYRKGSMVHHLDTVWYVDARQKKGMSVTFESIPAGSYDSVSFLIGLSPERNKSFSLTPAMEHSRMVWPEEMGGGYHFLKLEGHWLSADSVVHGYALHLGKTGFEVYAGCRINMDISSGGNGELPLTMDVNEWFQTPKTYDLSSDGVYTMGDAKLMRIVADNGADVFKSSK